MNLRKYIADLLMPNATLERRWEYMLTLDLKAPECAEIANQAFISLPVDINKDRASFERYLDFLEMEQEIDSFGLGLFFGVTTRITIFCFLEYLKCPKIHNFAFKVTIKLYFIKMKEAIYRIGQS